MSDSQIGTVAELRVRIRFAVVLSLAWLLAVVLFAWLPASGNLVAFGAAAAAACAALYSAYHAAEALHYRARRDQQGRSFDLLAAINEPAVVEVQSFCTRALEADQKSSEIWTRIQNDPKLYSALKTVLGHFEDISIAIQEDFADERILYRSLSFLVPWYHTKLGGYISEERLHAKDHSIYCEFEKLANAWREGASIRDGQSLKRGGN